MCLHNYTWTAFLQWEMLHSTACSGWTGLDGYQDTCPVQKSAQKMKKRVFFLTSGFLFISFKPSKPATSRRELKLDGTRAEMSYVFLTVKVIKHTSSLQGSKSSTAAFQKDKLHSNWSFGLSAEITGWTSMADYTGGQMYLFWFWAQINSMAKDAQGMLKHNN